MNLASKLNQYRVTATCSRSVVKLECVPPDEAFDAEEKLVSEEWNGLLDELQTYTTYVDPHPAGADRAGYVLFAEDAQGDTAFYSETSCEWE